MKKFNDFINEGLRDAMKPKSEEEIDAAITKLISRKNLSDSDLIIFIISKGYDFKFLPDNLTVNKNMNFDGGRVEKIPDGLTVNGDLNIPFTDIVELPENLTVTGNLDCNYCDKLKSLPDNLVVHGDVYIVKCDIPVTDNPSGVKGKIYR